MTAAGKPRIVFMTGGGDLYWIVANALVERFGPITIIREGAEPKGLFLRRRLRRLGAVTVMGQMLFTVLSKFIALMSRPKRGRIVAEHGADARFPSGCETIEVPSVNSPTCREALRAVSPDVVVVMGTRIIGVETLGCIDAPFINYHPGLTPKYRGMNGAYWTLAEGDDANLAVTLHLVDEGVDTGDILYQERVGMPAGNNIMTYHYYMAVMARPFAVKAVEDALSGQLQPRKSTLPSRQWFHPTLWDYLWTGLTRRVW